MKLKVYVDRMSQPSRAILIFCKLNGIDFEEVRIDIAKGQHRSPEFKEINPMRKVPAIVDGRFKLFERFRELTLISLKKGQMAIVDSCSSHAILRYLACAFPGVSDHWYPADLFTRAKIDSILDWHHSNLRRGAASFVLNSVLAPVLGFPLNSQAANEAEKVLSSSLSEIESVWLKGNAKFLLGNSQPSIADLSLVCEIMQFEVLHEKDRQRILGPHKKILLWIDNVKRATNPHFEEVHEILYKVKPRLHSRLASISNHNIEQSTKAKLSSKL